MLFEQRFGPGIAEGTITVTFRRWKRRQAVPGRPYRTPVGRIEVEAVDIVDPETVTPEDATRAGYASVDALLADLRGTSDLPLYRVRFHYLAQTDPRDVLAADDALGDDDRAEIDRRLARLDRASSRGPWTRATLEAIATHPRLRAADLAPLLGRERDPMKVDIRKLKNLGLTISLEVGYRLSPRGEAYLGRR